MDPVTFYRLGQIRHKEILDEALRNREIDGYPQRSLNLAALWQRFRARLSAAPAQTRQPECPTCPNPVTAS